MATVDEMQIRVGAIVTDAITNLRQVQTAMAETGTIAKEQTLKVDALGASFKGLSRNIVGIAAAATFVGVIDFLKNSAQIASTTNAQFAIMQQTMENVTGATVSDTEALKNQISQLGMHTNFMAAELIPSFDRLFEVTRNTSESMSLLSVAEDVAASKHVPLMQASQALAKAQDGIMFSLNRLAPETKDRANWLEILTKETKGAAEAAANLDPWKSMQVAFQNIELAAGNALLPTMQNLAKWFVSVVPAIQNFFKQLGDPTTAVGQEFKFMSDIIVGLFKFVIDHLGIITALGAAWLAVASAMKIATTAQWLLDVAMDANPVGAATLAIMGLVGAFILLNQAMGNTQSEFKGVPQSVQDKADAASAAAYNADLKAGGTGLSATTAAQKARDAIINTYKKAHPTDGSGGTDTTNGYDTYTQKLIKQLEAEQLQNKKDMAAYLKSLKANSGSTTGSSSSSSNSAENTLLKSINTIHQNIIDAQTKYNNDLSALETKYAAQIVSIQKDFSNKLLDVINQSKALLTDAFNSAASIDVGSIFAASFSSGTLSNTIYNQVKDGISVAVSWWGTASGGNGVSGLIQSLTDKLNASTKLAADTGALAGQGFSQNFIDQIVSQGTDLGDQMAQAILAASPDQQAALKQLYAANEQEALHGVDTVATALYTQQGLATEALKTLYAQTETDFADALSSAQDTFNSDSAALFATLTDSLDKAQSDLTSALQTAADSMGVSVSTVAAKYSGQVDIIQGAITSVKTQAKTALDDAQSWANDLASSAFSDTLKSVEDQAAQTITKLQAAVDSLSTAKAALGVSDTSGSGAATVDTSYAASASALNALETGGVNSLSAGQKLTLNIQNNFTGVDSTAVAAKTVTDQIALNTPVLLNKYLGIS